MLQSFRKIPIETKEFLNVSYVELVLLDAMWGLGIEMWAERAIISKDILFMNKNQT
jgi:hypothetical protein